LYKNKKLASLKDSFIFNTDENNTGKKYYCFVVVKVDTPEVLVPVPIVPFIVVALTTNFPAKEKVPLAGVV
jgi:hypothetical protein